MERETGKKAIRLSARWEIQMTEGNVRARYVAREFNNDNSCEFFAATTGGSTSRVIDTYAVEEGLVRFTFDASNAFLHVVERDFVVVKPPPGFVQAHYVSNGRDDCLWRVLRTLYGRRAAAQNMGRVDQR